MSLIQYVFRGEPGIPLNTPKIRGSFFTSMPAGKLLLILFFKPHSGQLYKSYDAFSFRYYIEKGHRYPMMSPALSYSQDIFFDNIHYEERLECYKTCLSEDATFIAVIEHDIAELKKRMLYVDNKEKLEKVKGFVDALEELSGK